MNARFSGVAMLALLVVVFISSGQMLLAQETGTLTGTVINKADGKPVIGASVFLVGTKLGGFSNQDGKYTIKNVPVGTYSLRISSVGLAAYNVTDIEITPNAVTKLDVGMETDAVMTEEVVVTARSLQDNDLALMTSRAKASAMSDAVGADRMEQTGSGDAGEAVSKITGASLVDGKYVNIRGLGDRYNKVQMNGSELPSADPNRKAVQLDVFPTNLLDNIVTVKTFTPDKPGDFTGGAVNIGTKSFPDAFTFKVSAGTTYDNLASFNDNFLTYNTGDTDWLGSDDGTRELPGPVASRTSEEIPDISTAFGDEDAANLLIDLTESFTPDMDIRTGSTPVNQSFSLAVGNNAELFGRKLGVLGSITYKRNFSFYENGTTARWKRTSETSTTLNEEANFTDTKGTSSALLSGLATVAYMIDDKNEVSANLMMSQSGASTARYQEGFLATLPVPFRQTFETRTLLYNERNVMALQGGGKHFFPKLAGAPVRLTWNLSNTTSTQEEPDLRFFSNHYSQALFDTTIRIFGIAEQNYNPPSRYFRNLEDNILELRSDLEITIDTWTNKTGSIKFGGLYSNSTREFAERRFQYNSTQIYQGDPNDHISGSSIVDSSGNLVSAIQDVSTKSNIYDGDQVIAAGYLMADLPITEDLRVIGGARIESTDIEVLNSDEKIGPGEVNEVDILPSLNVVYSIDESMNVRLAATQTLARPTFRELAPFSAFNFIGDFIETGNVELDRTTVINLDLRWEWFIRPGEIVAVSGFYKDFTNPIERVILNENGEVKFQNVDEAVLFGAEFEARKSLDEIADVLSNFQVGMNLTIIESQVDIEAGELELIRGVDANAEATRQLYGQSPYIFNADLSYSNLESGTNVALSYNIFGERLTAVTLGGTPDVFEQPRGMLNLTFSQQVTEQLVVKGSASNILDQRYEETQEFLGETYDFQTYDIGQAFSFGVSFSIQ